MDGQSIRLKYGESEIFSPGGGSGLTNVILFELLLPPTRFRLWRSSV
jgi:hypothetical protein